jgi:hypothetical protein
MTSSTLYRAVIAAAVATVPLIGCERRRDLSGVDLRRDPTTAELEQRQKDWGEPQAPMAIGGGPVDVSGAIDRIVEARCAREASCGYIGGDKKWASADACDEVVSREYADDLSAEECPAGVDGNELAECVEESRNADCANPIDVIGRVAACRPSQLCRK